MKYLYLLLIQIILPILVQGNTNIINKIDSLNNVAWDISLDDPSKAIQLSDKALELAQTINYLKGLSTSNNYLGIFYTDKNIFAKAEVHFLEAVKVRKLMGYTEGIAYVYDNLCRLKRSEGDYLEAINYGFKALEILTKMDKEKEEPTLYLNLGIAHQFNKDTTDAITYYKKGLEVAEIFNDSINLASLHYNLGNLYVENNKYTKANFHFNRALSLYKAIKYKIGEAVTYDGFGNILAKKKEYEKAIKMFNKSISINLERKDSIYLFYNYIELSKLYNKQKKLKDALSSIKQANNLLKGKEGLETKEILNKTYADIYQESKDYKKALQYYQKAETLKDSIFNLDKVKSIVRLQKENAEREKVVAQLQAENAKIEKVEEQFKNQRLLGILAISSLGFLLGLFFLNQRRVRKEQELLAYKEQQERIIDRRIIDATQKIRKELSRNLHNHVSTPLTHIKRFLEPVYKQLSFDPEWQNSLSQAIHIADKAHVTSRDISYQLKPEKIDWIDRIKISLIALEKKEKVTTSLSVKDLQEETFSKIKGEKICSVICNLLSNVDQHSQASEVSVRIQQLVNELDIVVADNGIGFETKQTKGVGLESIYTDVEVLNGTIDIESAPNQGTIIKVKIPVSYAE